MPAVLRVVPGVADAPLLAAHAGAEEAATVARAREEVSARRERIAAVEHRPRSRLEELHLFLRFSEEERAASGLHDLLRHAIELGVRHVLPAVDRVGVHEETPHGPRRKVLLDEEVARDRADLVGIARREQILELRTSIHHELQRGPDLAAGKHIRLEVDGRGRDDGLVERGDARQDGHDLMRLLNDAPHLVREKRARGEDLYFLVDPSSSPKRVFQLTGWLDAQNELVTVSHDVFLLTLCDRYLPSLDKQQFTMLVVSDKDKISLILIANNQL